MANSGFHVFSTALGHCGLAWGEHGIVGIQLPENDVDATRQRLAERFPTLTERTLAPPHRLARSGIVALLAGGSPDLERIVLDMRAVTPFRRAVYTAARAIPRGVTATYGELAARLGQRGSARAVGQALGANPFPVVVPCHRVLAAGGKSGGFSAGGGVATKLRMLAIEGAQLASDSGAGHDNGGFAFELAAAERHLAIADRTLAQTIAAVGPCRMQRKPTGSTFAALAEAIVYQQLNGRAAATIFGRVQALVPKRRDGLRAADFATVSDEQLRAAGLSRNKLLALRDLAARTIDGNIPGLAALARLDDDLIVEQLSQVRGIGRWTVEMLLMFRLGRPDVLPVDDYGVRQGYAIAYRKRALPTRQELARAGERWRPYRSVASWYLWRAAERARS